ncbi:hypothetical protein LEP1GSC016_3529 [Leptospira borgpetersenii serovar Hardjo-bovis str. Sponselee]|uniref:Uncharacterized protein n=6 Tax=Leptospira borgpetersenii TaxID=174 RepID=M3GGN5_LEPBO|nr:hypothetical protein LBBP_01397 [Leptospira borgpetersenii serovar Ballum]EKP12150.1 hypothetical protein LEP1GSC128_0091 [Leptospira borgpetersenii str. 200801926]EKQ90941.1 hypothetical protein LEP1GSC101_1363 [Leptospira borgpetersenii str. UI 09149]EKR00373.1 hypothetical protein LEP1GSC121_1362 [Leptospira borgpetersenii serovar Castellonis str. 200801910]EMG00132.1 hypothetical protein LEP1GSC123_3332 [Leptospira borgpetersenii str. 200701203]EMJ82520.1 hypothetical protein LEP1GSC016
MKGKIHSLLTELEKSAWCSRNRLSESISSSGAILILPG